MVVQSLDPDLVEVGDTALVILPGIVDGEIHIGVEISQGRLQGAPTRTRHSHGHCGIAVRPAGVFAQIEGVEPTILADIPGAGHSGRGSRVLLSLATSPSIRAVIILCSGTPVAIWGSRLWGSVPLPQCSVPFLLPDETLLSEEPQALSKSVRQ